MKRKISKVVLTLLLALPYAINAQSEVFDRNRLYRGIGYQINKNIKLEAGYMNQFFETSSRDQLNLITFVSF